MNIEFEKGQELRISLGGKCVSAFVNGWQDGFGSIAGFWLITIREGLTERLIGGGTFAPKHFEEAGAVIEEV